jgi:alpha-methylacyl-CoA racemase
MVLADYGADVVRVDSPSSHQTTTTTTAGSFSFVDTLCRRKKSIVVDLKSASSRRAFLDLVDVADVLIDPYRPGTLEKLGLGPEILCRRNPRLIYARLTGFSSSSSNDDENGLYARRAGHELNYLAVSGALSALLRLSQKDQTQLQKPSIDYLVDFSGGSMACVVGILMALLHRTATGEGQVVDASVVDGLSYLSTFLRQRDRNGQPPGEPPLDAAAAAPYYDLYQTQDGKSMAVAAFEPRFYEQFVQGLGLDPAVLPDRNDRANWLELKRIFTERFTSRTQQDWRGVFDGVDACVTPVLEGDKDSPLVSLSKSPSLPMEDERDSWPVLTPGEGSEGVLQRWLGSKSSTIAIEPGTRLLSREFRESKL